MGKGGCALVGLLHMDTLPPYTYGSPPRPPYIWIHPPIIMDSLPPYTYGYPPPMCACAFRAHTLFPYHL